MTDTTTQQQHHHTPPDDRGGDRGGDRETLSGVGRSLPASKEAERAVLGCCISYPDLAIPAVLAAVGSGDNVWHFSGNHTIWAAMVGRWQASGFVDLTTLNQDLTDAGEIDRIGGSFAVADLITEAPMFADLEHYLKIVRDKAIRRNMFVELNKVAASVYDYDIDTPELIDTAEAALFSLREFATNKKKAGLQPAADILPEVVEELQHAFENRGKTTRGIECGFPSIDRMLMGLAPACLYIIGARPSMGKTALMMNMVENMALEGGHAGAVFSLEMSGTELLKRTLSGRSGVQIYHLRDGLMSRDGIGKLFEAAEEIKKAGTLYIDDSPGLSIMELRSRARRAKAQHDIKFIAIDYVQLLKSGSKQAQNSRYVEVGEISRGLKEMAKELDLPVIVLAQLGRKVEERKNNRPKLSDLRESGDLEQDADVVALLTRPGYYAEREEVNPDEVTDHDAGFEDEADRKQAIFIIAKQRNGPVGDVQLQFDKESVRFTDPNPNLYN